MKAIIRKRFEIKSAAVNSDERTFEGYASTWDTDSDGDQIQPGAFKKSLTEAFPKGKVKILFNHDWNQPIGIPVEMSEDTKGLFVKGRVSRTSLGDEVLELMKDGVLDAMSIGFRVFDDKVKYDEDEGVFKISEVQLMEFSPVVFPANEAAEITSVSKSLKMEAPESESKETETKGDSELSGAFDFLSEFVEKKADDQDDSVKKSLEDIAKALDLFNES